MKKGLLLRGIIDFLGHAIVHIGKGQPVNEWSDGKYRNPAIEAADAKLRKALWTVERELDDHKKANA